ncbi:hypothetical protein B0H16DRAFT_1703170 [Mycena metata]|uniref:Uncharacterized protein n=1 Tax=Mycena metata TaxID=1033252 RepID=A0AAD7H492_9AGAR|nr:hypothetical protein B0H16DRAFT_1703170 [Mycena metata]
MHLSYLESWIPLFQTPSTCLLLTVPIMFAFPCTQPANGRFAGPASNVPTSRTSLRFKNSSESLSMCSPDKGSRRYVVGLWVDNAQLLNVNTHLAYMSLRLPGIHSARRSPTRSEAQGRRGPLAAHPYERFRPTGGGPRSAKGTDSVMQRRVNPRCCRAFCAMGEETAGDVYTVRQRRGWPGISTISRLLDLRVRYADFEAHRVRLASPTLAGSPTRGTSSAHTRTRPPQGLPVARVPDYLDVRVRVADGETRHSRRAMVQRVRDVRTGAGPNTVSRNVQALALSRVYLSTHAAPDFVRELSVDLEAEGEEQAVAQAVDMNVPVAAEEFVGIGFSSLTSNVVQLARGAKDPLLLIYSYLLWPESFRLLQVRRHLLSCAFIPLVPQGACRIISSTPGQFQSVPTLCLPLCCSRERLIPHAGHSWPPSNTGLFFKLIAHRIRSDFQRWCHDRLALIRRSRPCNKQSSMTRHTNHCQACKEYMEALDYFMLALKCDIEKNKQFTLLIRSKIDDYLSVPRRYRNTSRRQRPRAVNGALHAKRYLYTTSEQSPPNPNPLRYRLGDETKKLRAGLADGHGSDTVTLT